MILSFSSSFLLDEVGGAAEPVLDELGHVLVLGLAQGVDGVALLGAGHATDHGGKLEPDGGGGGVDEALLGLEERGHGLLHAVEALAGGVAGVDQAHELLGAVVLVLQGGAQEQLVQELVLGDDLLGLAAVAPLAVAPPAAAATTTREGQNNT